MPTRRQFVAVAGMAALGGCGGTDGSTTDTATTTPGAPDTGTTPAGDATVEDTPHGDSETAGTTIPSGAFAVSTDAFEDGGSIPQRYTADGEDVSPPFTISGVPSEAGPLALVVDDPDANDFVHWLLWNVPAERTSLPEGIDRTETVDSLDGARQGTNGFGDVGYRGPSPPEDDGPHTYEFTFHAIDSTLDVEAGATRSELADPLSAVSIATTTYSGTYDR
jgi:Raf kinase inhibitor-like YbhB/YbcL family protein